MLNLAALSKEAGTYIAKISSIKCWVMFILELQGGLSLPFSERLYVALLNLLGIPGKLGCGQGK